MNLGTLKNDILDNLICLKKKLHYNFSLFNILYISCYIIFYFYIFYNFDFYNLFMFILNFLSLFSNVISIPPSSKLNGTNFFGMGDKDQLSKIMADVIFRPFIINENLILD